MPQRVVGLGHLRIDAEIGQRGDAQARVGDRVIWIDAREAPKALPGGYGAVDACVVGIVDAAG